MNIQDMETPIWVLCLIAKYPAKRKYFDSCSALTEREYHKKKGEESSIKSDKLLLVVHGSGDDLAKATFAPRS
jgi:hypothetical protein